MFHERLFLSLHLLVNLVCWRGALKLEGESFMTRLQRWKKSEFVSWRGQSNMFVQTKMHCFSITVLFMGEGKCMHWTEIRVVDLIIYFM